MSEKTGPILAADGTPLKKKLAQTLFRSRARAFGLVFPLLAFILIAFIVPIISLLTQAVYDDEYASAMPKTSALVAQWDGMSEPTEEMYQAVVQDIIVSMAVDRPLPTKAASRLNREISGATSMTKKLIRSVGKFKLDYDGKKQDASGIIRSLEAEDSNGVPLLSPDERRAIGETLAQQAVAEYAPMKPIVLDADDSWDDIEYWQGMKVAAKKLTPSFVATSLDYNYLYDGSFEKADENRRIHITLFLRTFEISLIVTIATLLLGYPVGYMLSTLPTRTSNLLLILVLLPFWTSLLVRTTAWIAMLQGEGVLNDLFVVFGIASDEDRFSLIYNKTGTLIAMTHILLPFMILPLYSVMKTIPPSYVRAAKSMGATPWTAFWRVYFPQSVPGIGAGALLVFILAIGYYITPALVGGQDGQMISNIIDEHMRKSLNDNLAAAISLVLLIFVLFLFWLYDRFVGIDNMKLG